MGFEYEFDNLSAVPDMGMLQDGVENSGMSQTSWEDISFHPGDMWLKVWFVEELSSEDQQILGALVDECLGVDRFQKESSSVYFELVSIKNKRWERHRRRVRFQSEFDNVPEVTISGANFDGTANLEILSTTKKHFDFRVTAVNGKGKLRGLTTVEFDWEARAWQA